MSRILEGRAFVLLAVGSLACTSNVQSGLPPLVRACQAAADCPAPYRCVGGACEIASCHCDGECPAPLLCEVKLSVVGQCLEIAEGAPCDAGSADAGTTDGG